MSILLTNAGIADGNEINFNKCNEKWVWEKKDRWNICKEKRFAYKIEVNNGNTYVINMFYSSSGSGEFTDIKLIEIKNNVINTIESIADGDRWQHGIISENIQFRDNNLYYSELITAYHIMDWSGRNLDLGAYSDCMICCVGSANYKYNPKTRIKEFINIELLLDKLDGSDEFSKTYNT